MIEEILELRKDIVELKKEKKRLKWYEFKEKKRYKDEIVRLEVLLHFYGGGR